MPSIGEELFVEKEDDNQHDNHAVAVMPRRTRTCGQGVIIDCGRYHNVYDQALIQDPASNTVCHRYTPSL